VKWRVVGAVLLALVYAGLWVLAIGGASDGASALVGPLVTLPVLVLLIAAGNWFQHWTGIRREGPKFARPAAEHDTPRDAPGP
jgi:hypothetical protein